ncbi:hypothetical protein AVDCRST_MAG82-2619 [uncultured Rubrobacteraceae bacterium]|uniref:Uncharacterized protein n=1 Tax=uncultured Rubrobacteraceae bacterium TaxID=349277 RepID=A0A6J4QHS0_9ACTN|nr:hypothetical protein AVDCRST_MAG82-2619 [uncultured Rubrobacteraceae bacterium]
MLATPFDTEVEVTLSERLKNLWMLLTTEEILSEDGGKRRRTVLRRPPRG